MMELPENTALTEEPQDQNIENGGHFNPDAPIVFIRGSSIFGDKKVSFKEWVKHDELFKAIAVIIDQSHITGLQRVNGLWRIYLDNLEDKATLVAEGILLRHKVVPVLHSNPFRLDGENTIRIRIQNIPLSADDNTIKRVCVLKGLDIISIQREKRRIDGKLTNCNTGDRLVTVKQSSLKEPLPRFMEFGQFKAKVIHKGQKAKPMTCKKCLQEGHTSSTCENDWKCVVCSVSGQKRTMPGS